MASKEFARLLAELGNRFDYVIIDSPSVVGSSDALTAAASSDGVLVVTRRKSRLSDLRQVRERLADVKTRLVGSVYCQFAKATAHDAPEPPATEHRVVDDESRRARSGHRL